MSVCDQSKLQSPFYSYLFILTLVVLSSQHAFVFVEHACTFGVACLHVMFWCVYCEHACWCEPSETLKLLRRHFVQFSFGSTHSTPAQSVFSSIAPMEKVLPKFQTV